MEGTSKNLRAVAAALKAYTQVQMCLQLGFPPISQGVYSGWQATQWQEVLKKKPYSEASEIPKERTIEQATMIRTF